MIACPKCNSSNEDDALVCHSCSSLLDGPRPLAPRTGRVHKVEATGEAEAQAESGEEERSDDDDGHMSSLGDSFELPDDDGDEQAATEGDYGTRRLEARDPEPGRAEPPPLTAPRESARRTTAPLDAGHQSAISHYRRGRPVISVIGFPSSGKTFLVN
ncbi:MAG TPA: hypothetical protein VKU40_16230, partial [Thermoanaerobaculia bacterium]|nr:hypothetical protein [Thermoanaerobaculia bacterium]